MFYVLNNMLTKNRVNSLRISTRTNFSVLRTNFTHLLWQLNASKGGPKTAPWHQIAGPG